MIPKKIAICLLPLIILVASLPVGGTHAQIELIANGGFETGDLTGWVPVGPVFDGSVTNNEFHSGFFSLLLGAVDFVEQTISPAANPNSDLTFWAKTNGFAGVANTKVEYSDGTSDTLLFGGVALSPIGDWKQFTLSIDPGKQVSRVEFSVAESDPIYIDDISLSGLFSPLTLVTSLLPVTLIPLTPIKTTIITPITPQVTLIQPVLTPITSITLNIPCFNVIDNGGFETGDFTSWTTFGSPFGGSITNNEFHTGTYSLLLTKYGYIEHTFSSAISPTSDLKFWAKTNGLAEILKTNIEYSDGTNDIFELAGDGFSSVWKQFAVSVDQTKLVSRVDFGITGPYPIFIDDVSLCGGVNLPIIQATTPKVETTIPETLSLTSKSPVTVTVTEDQTGPPIPGFMSLPALFGLILLVLVFRRRRT